MQTNIQQLCKQLKLPIVYQCAEALKEEHQGVIAPLDFLHQVLEEEWQQRVQNRAERCIKSAGFPKLKTLESFDFSKAPHLPETKIKTLIQGQYITKAEPVIFIGEPGTGKTHLATAFGYAAAANGITIKFITASRLAHMLIEAKDNYQLNRLINTYKRVRVLIIDELGYLPLSTVDAELIFQLLSERHEISSVIITTNLPFSEWTNVFKDKRLCCALIDRLTCNAHIIDTGLQSARLKKELAKKHESDKKIVQN